MTLKIGFSGALERCREYLRAELADGPKLRVELEKAAKAQGYNPANLHAAARTMGIVSDRVRVHGAGWRASWRLPPENAAGDRPVNPPPSPSTPLPVADDSPVTIGDQLARLQTENRMVDIYRRVDGELGFVDSLPGTECTLRQIKRRFGGGRYNLEGHEFTIEGSPLSPEGELKVMRPRGSQVVQDGASSSSGGFDTAALLMTLIKQQGDILVALLTKGNPSAPDPVAMFTAIETAVAKRLETQPAQPVDQALALLREGMTLGRSAAEGFDPEDDPDRGFNRTLDRVAPFLNMLAARLAPGAQPAAAAPAPAGPQLVPDDGGMAVTALQQVLADLGPTVPQLLEECRKGTAAQAVAEFIHTNATEEQYDALAEAAEDPQFVEELLEELGKRVAPLKAGWAMPWLKTAVESLNELLAADRRDESAGGNANGQPAPSGAGTGGGAPTHRPGGAPRP